MQCNSLKCYDVDQLPDDTFTFISYGESHCKWLDHIIGKNSSHVRVKDIKAYFDLTDSDHFPIAACVEVKNAPHDISKSRCSLNRGNISYFVNWEKLNGEELKSVDDVALSVMGSFRNNIAALCSHIGCTDEQHIIKIYNIYHKIAGSVDAGSKNFFKGSKKYLQIQSASRMEQKCKTLA